MGVLNNQKGSLAGLLWYTIIVVVSSASYKEFVQTVNREKNFWRNEKAGLAGALWYIIVVVVLIIILILALRFLFNII
jgi:hypothetical protein